MTALAGCDAVWRSSLRPSNVPAFLDAAGPGLRLCLDWGGGLVWTGTEYATGAGADAAGLHHRLQAATARLGGHSTLVKGAPDLRRAVPVQQPEPTAVAALTHGLRATFDPRGLFSPKD